MQLMNVKIEELTNAGWLYSKPKSAGDRLRLNIHAPYVCGCVVRGCMVYTDLAETTAVSCGTSHVTTKQRFKYITGVDIQNELQKATVTHLESRATKAQ